MIKKNNEYTYYFFILLLFLLFIFNNREIKAVTNSFSTNDKLFSSLSYASKENPIFPLAEDIKNKNYQEETTNNFLAININSSSTNILENVDNIDDEDNPNYQLEGAGAITTTRVGENTYLFVAGWNDEGISVFQIANNGKLSYVDSVDDKDNPNYQLDKIQDITSAEINGNTYLFAGGWGGNSISTFKVTNDGKLIYFFNSKNNKSYILNGVNFITIYKYNGQNYLLATGGRNDELSIFKVENNGSLTPIQSIPRNIYDNMEVINSVTSIGRYLIIGSEIGYEGHVSGFIENNEKLYLEDSFIYKPSYQFKGSIYLRSSALNGIAHLFIAGFYEDSIDVFKIKINNNNSREFGLDYIAIFNDYDNPNYKLNGPRDLTTTIINNSTYLFVAGYYDDGISVFKMTNNGQVVHIASVDDKDNLNYELDGVHSLTTATINGTTYLFAAGWSDNGVSVFRLNVK